MGQTHAHIISRPLVHSLSSFGPQRSPPPHETSEQVTEWETTIWKIWKYSCNATPASEVASRCESTKDTTHRFSQNWKNDKKHHIKRMDGASRTPGRQSFHWGIAAANSSRDNVPSPLVSNLVLSQRCKHCFVELLCSAKQSSQLIKLVKRLSLQHFVGFRPSRKGPWGVDDVKIPSLYVLTSHVQSPNSKVQI